MVRSTTDGHDAHVADSNFADSNFTDCNIASDNSSEDNCDFARFSGGFSVPRCLVQARGRNRYAYQRQEVRVR